jgi:hypothetical protein
MSEKEWLALEWLYRMACSGQNTRYALTIQDMLIDRGVNVCVQHRVPLRDGWPGWPKDYRP